MQVVFVTEFGLNGDLMCYLQMTHWRKSGNRLTCRSVGRALRAKP